MEPQQEIVLDAIINLHLYRSSDLLLRPAASKTDNKQQNKVSKVQQHTVKKEIKNICPRPKPLLTYLTNVEPILLT